MARHAEVQDGAISTSVINECLAAKPSAPIARHQLRAQPIAMHASSVPGMPDDRNQQAALSHSVAQNPGLAHSLTVHAMPCHARRIRDENHLGEVTSRLRVRQKKRQPGYYSRSREDCAPLQCRQLQQKAWGVVETCAEAVSSRGASLAAILRFCLGIFRQMIWRCEQKEGGLDYISSFLGPCLTQPPPPFRHQ
jgi:hypothetical protein